MRNKFKSGKNNPMNLQEQKERQRQRMLGENNPMYKRNFSEEHRRKIGDAARGKRINEKNPNWKGDNVGLKPLHGWLRRHKPKPDQCEECNLIPAYDLANISGKYLRDLNDYRWLCRGCHMKYDYKIGIRSFSEVNRNPIRDKNGYWIKYAAVRTQVDQSSVDL
jgi:hypothetical protein